MEVNKNKSTQKNLEVYIDRHGGYRIDGCWINDTETLKLYKGFKFHFVRACWAVTEYHVKKVKDRFIKYELLNKKGE